MRSFIFVAAAAAGLASAADAWESDVTVTATSTRTHTYCPVTQVTTCDAAASTDVSGDSGPAGDAWWSKWQSQKSEYGITWSDWAAPTTTTTGSAASTTSYTGSSTSGTYTSTSTTTSSSGSCATYTPPKNATDDICNSAADRSKWCDGKDIDTDYYDGHYYTGVTREYTLTITNTTLVYDGTGPKIALAVNGQVPGPVIEANWGDIVQITVINQLADNSTSIHWHGIRQLGTNGDDGVAGVTECGIAGNGGSRVYTWHASQYGTSWYHSHMFAQYGDGIRGPIVIHGPATADYDYDLGTLMLDDT
jgi:laccase